MGAPPVPGAMGGMKGMQTTTGMNMVLFGAACCIMFSSFICFLGSLTSNWVHGLEMLYFFLFGVLLAVLDTPFFKTIKAIGDLKMYIGKYVELLTRVTGKGVSFIFVSSSLFASMWINFEGGFIRFIAVVTNLFVGGVGAAAIVIGVMKSNKLNKAKMQLQNGVLENRYPYWAQRYRNSPQGGLTPNEFNNLTMENGGFKWEDADLKLIFSALVANPSWRISALNSQQGNNPTAMDEPRIPLEDLKRWVYGGMTWL